MAISEAREAVHHSYGSVALCLGCNYALRGLPEPRCPECGREFDLDDPKSFNSERPLRWIDRTLLKPIGWPMFTALGLLCAGYLSLGIFPDIYYSSAYIIFSILVLIVVAVMLVARSFLRAYIPPRSIFQKSMVRRERIAFMVFGLSFLLMLFHVPLRILFFFAKPDLDRVAGRIEDGTLTQPLQSHRIGPLLMSSTDYGNENQYFFVVHELHGGGFAYCRNGEEPSRYNTGTDGHLWGNWYWWIGD
jgi:hypothetical protein